jgi:hypothetical protein
MVDSPSTRLTFPGEGRIDIETEGLDTEVAEEFNATARSTAQLFGGMARIYGVEPPDLVLIAVPDFRQAVDDLLKKQQGPNQPDYTVERLGGRAVAKNIPLNKDHSRIAIVIAADPWVSKEAAARAIGLYLMAHEMTHGVLDRLRNASGALEGVTFPSQQR